MNTNGNSDPLPDACVADHMGSHVSPHASPDTTAAEAGQRAVSRIFLLSKTPHSSFPPREERRKPPAGSPLLPWCSREPKPLLLPSLGGENSPHFFLISLQVPPLLPVFPKAMSSFATLGRGDWESGKEAPSWGAEDNRKELESAHQDPCSQDPSGWSLSGGCTAQLGREQMPWVQMTGVRVWIDRQPCGNSGEL